MQYSFNLVKKHPYKKKTFPGNETPKRLFQFSCPGIVRAVMGVKGKVPLYNLTVA